MVGRTCAPREVQDQKSHCAVTFDRKTSHGTTAEISLGFWSWRCFFYLARRSTAGEHLLPTVSLHGMVENFEDEIEEESELALMAQFLSDETLHCLTGGTTALIFQVRAPGSATWCHLSPDGVLRREGHSRGGDGAIGVLQLRVRLARLDLFYLTHPPILRIQLSTTGGLVDSRAINR